jgi:hypothetical protein
VFVLRPAGIRFRCLRHAGVWPSLFRSNSIDLLKSHLRLKQTKFRLDASPQHLSSFARANCRRNELLQCPSHHMHTCSTNTAPAVPPHLCTSGIHHRTQASPPPLISPLRLHFCSWFFYGTYDPQKKIKPPQKKKAAGSPSKPQKRRRCGREPKSPHSIRPWGLRLYSSVFHAAFRKKIESQTAGKK